MLIFPRRFYGSAFCCQGENESGSLARWKERLKGKRPLEEIRHAEHFSNCYLLVALLKCIMFTSCSIKRVLLKPEHSPATTVCKGLDEMCGVSHLPETATFFYCAHECRSRLDLGCKTRGGAVLCCCSLLHQKRAQYICEGIGLKKATREEWQTQYASLLPSSSFHAAAV